MPGGPRHHPHCQQPAHHVPHHETWSQAKENGEPLEAVPKTSLSLNLTYEGPQVKRAQAVLDNLFLKKSSNRQQACVFHDIFFSKATSKIANSSARISAPVGEHVMCRHCNFSILQQGTQHLGFSPKMRGHGTLKLQDETIDLPYDPLEIAIVVAPTFP